MVVAETEHSRIICREKNQVAIGGLTATAYRVGVFCTRVRLPLKVGGQEVSQSVSQAGVQRQMMKHVELDFLGGIHLFLHDFLE